MGEKIYTVGSLSYRLPKLLAVCFYLLWGGFFYSMLAYVLIPTLLPLAMSGFGASGALIGLVCGSIPAAMNMFMSPVLSTSSDRLRSRWGRRIPYLAFSAPFVTFFMILVGWTPEMVELLRTVLGKGLSAEQADTLGVVLICVFSVLFQFFNLFVGNVYYYLLPDVLPRMVIGRFFSLLNVIMALAGFVFNWFLLQYAKTAASWVFTGVGLLFLLSFLPICLLLREGEYPPPAPAAPRSCGMPARMRNWVVRYCQECFSNPFFLLFFIGTGLNQVSTACRNMFNTLFALKELGLSEAQLGRIMGLGSLCSIAAMLGAGYLVDKYHPLRIYMATGAVIVGMNVFGYFFAVDYGSFLVVGVATVLIYSLQNMTGLPMCVALLPKERFGQFASANSIVNCLLMIFANYLGGVAIDGLGYRFMFVWDFVFTILALLLMCQVYRRWKQYGGDHGYTPPV